MASKIQKWLKQAEAHITLEHSQAAEKFCRKILKEQPAHSGALLVLGKALYFRKQYDEAIETLKKLLDSAPDHADARMMLYFCYRDNKDFAHTLEMARAFHNNTDMPNEQVAAYQTFLDICDWDAAQGMQDRILDMAMRGDINNEQIPGLLMALNTAPGISPDQMYAIHKAWGESILDVAKQFPRLKPASEPGDGRLKIAYLSSDFNSHPVGMFIESLIACHDRSRFEVYCYAHLLATDELTTRIQQSADHFVDITPLSYYEIAGRIRADGIHILVELGGHTGLSRLQALAFRPAPVQITYLGYPNTTGLPTVDFRITDAFAEDMEGGTRYTEKLLTMPQSFLCLGDRKEAARTDTTPAIGNGYITFGSFNNVRKFNAEVISAWSRILQQVDRSKLVIKSPAADNAVIQGNLLKQFTRHGIDAERIRFVAYLSSAEHAALFNEIDIALDCFPYNGTTTTCETLWMGVPMVTLVGKQHVQRTSYSIMKNIGFDALAAFSVDEYVSKAVELAARPDNLSFLRKCLPTLIENSILFQPKEFTRQIEGLYERAWQEKTGVETKASSLPSIAPGITGATKKPLRLIHNLARSGSTLMCKCLGSMQGINLLSEIHPQAVNHFNPLDQAHEWFGLLTPEDVSSLQNTAPSFSGAIRLIDQRSSERGDRLVIRDWAHLDFVGVPFLPAPSFRLRLAEDLANAFDLKQIAFVRHPIDQWLSLSRLEIMQQPIASGRFSIDTFIHGYLRFAQQCAGFGLIRYEDFTQAPAETMKQVCGKLDLPYDPSFIDKWRSYTTITGDVVSTRGGNEIRQLKRRDVSDETLEHFTNNPEYPQLLDVLGYCTSTIESPAVCSTNT